MSRSRKHTPVISWCGTRSCKAWRTQENGRYRAYAKNLVAHERYDDIQDFKGRFGNEWDSPRDGKYWYTAGKGKPCGTDTVYSSWISGVFTPTCKGNDHWRCHKAYLKQMRK